MNEIDEVKKISISAFMSYRGFKLRSSGSKMFCKSPFCRDTNWSLCIYMDTNSFYDWTQGFGGSIIDLVMAMDNLSFSDAVKSLSNGGFEALEIPNSYKQSFKAFKASESYDFEYTRYLTHSKEEVAAIATYGASRGLVSGYEYGVFFTRWENGWVRNPSLMFLHRNLDGKICGCKFRRIDSTTPSDKDNSPRFSARGSMGCYILENVDEENFGDPNLYVVEGEANANSLWQYLKEVGVNCVIISFGGVGSLPESLPEKYKSIKNKKLIIDYDENGELYKKRLRLYKPYGLDPIKMILPKGEDINSLYCNNKMNLLTNLL